MGKPTCEVCLVKKTELTCHRCQKVSCKYCNEFVDSLAIPFSFYLPPELQDTHYCPQCYDSHIAQQILEHQQAYEKAHDVDVFSKAQSSETRLYKRLEPAVKVDRCEDRKQAILQLAFLAARQGFDTLIDLDLKSSKEGKGKYKRVIWSGTAIPCNNLSPR